MFEERVGQGLTLFLLLILLIISLTSYEKSVAKSTGRNLSHRDLKSMEDQVSSYVKNIYGDFNIIARQERGNYRKDRVKDYIYLVDIGIHKGLPGHSYCNLCAFKVRASFRKDNDAYNKNGLTLFYLKKEGLGD